MMLDKFSGGWREQVIAAQKGNTDSYAKLLKNIAANLSGPYKKTEDQAIIKHILIGIHKALKTYDSKCDFKLWLEALIEHRSYQSLQKEKL